MTKQDKVIWKDSSKILWKIPWVDEYVLHSQHLIVERGLLSRQRDVIMLYKITDMQIDQSLLGRIFGVGHLTLFTNDKTNRKIKFKNISDPSNVMDKFLGLVNKARKENNIKITEMSGV